MDLNILGARGTFVDIPAALQKVSDLEKAHDSTIQLLRADRIIGREHIETAVELASRSWSNSPRAKTLGMEILLYAAAERQISMAIEKLGITQGMSKFAVVIVGSADTAEVLNELGLERDDTVLDSEGKDHSIFGFTEMELTMASIPDLVLERMALNELNR